MCEGLELTASAVVGSISTLCESQAHVLQLINSDHFGHQLCPVCAQITVQQSNCEKSGARLYAAIACDYSTLPAEISRNSEHVLFSAGGAPFGCLMRPNGPRHDQDVSAW